MTYEDVIPNLGDWLLKGLGLTLIRVAVVTLAGLLIGFLIAAARRGPVEGFYAVAKVIASAVVDLSNWSLRRTIAMAMLAVQEAIRRRVLIAFAVFVVLILFGGWYLDVQSDHPARLYLSFVLTASNYLVLLLALFLSTFSLPADIKNRTIYTVVTKPVRALEIVLGRIIGFVVVGTLLLVAMGVVSYFFVKRGLRHEHAVETVAPATDGSGGWQGETTFDSHHRHRFTVRADGTGETDLVTNHIHEVTRVGEGDAAAFEIGPPIGLLQARIPTFGTLRFKDRAGNDAAQGINVGHEWAYRSYIEGGTGAAAIWTFEGITPERYPDGFDLELNLRVFRTYKGDIERGILGTIVLRNPKPGARIERSEDINFTAVEFRSDKKAIPRQLRVFDSEEGSFRDGDLFELTDNGRLEIWVRCGERSQYYGMAERDVYLLEEDGSFAWNLAKCYVGIWLQMVIVTSFGVMFSTFLTGAVAMLATLASIGIGYLGKFIVGVATGSLMGGGPIEALIRIVTQLNLQVDLDIGRVPLAIIQGIDRVLMGAMRAMSGILPNYGVFNTVPHVAYGYNIDGALMTIQVLTAFSYVAAVSLVAYFLLKTREIAS